MYRQILIPKDINLILQIPANFVGKKVEIIAFTVEDDTAKSKAKESNERAKEIDEFYNSVKIDFANYKFDREEANERYDQRQRLKKLMKFIQQNPVNLPKDYRFNREELYE